MNENIKTILTITIPIISSLITALIAWVLRGRWENKKMEIELQQLGMDLRKEEVDFRNELMMEVHKLQRQVFILEQTVHKQSLEIEMLTHSLQEKDRLLQKLQP